MRHFKFHIVTVPPMQRRGQSFPKPHGSGRQTTEMVV